MAFLSIIFSCPDSLYENIIAELSDSEVDSYFETESLIAYILKDNWNDNLKANLDALSIKYSMTYEIEELEDTNWNAVWESNFKPVSIDSFCHIRASFHPKETGYIHEIEISPKMAFGTGHHETTSMMIRQMSNLDFSQKTILDYGCGTGILSVLADKMGASVVDAIDIDKNSIDNAKEHVEINAVSNVKITQGDLDALDRASYDIILANINRTVLINQATKLFDLLKDNGQVLMSGILESDRFLIEEKYLDAGFKVTAVHQDGDWLCFNILKLVHNPS